jgi:beta-lysine 5,6-aminomutase beta subunit
MQIRPYGDTANDGVVQLSFTLPVAMGARALEAARRYAALMGISNPLVAHAESVDADYTFFVIYGACFHTLDLEQIRVDEPGHGELDFYAINELIGKRLGRRITVIGAAIESDAHTVGIDAIFNAKGFAGNYGLERFPAFRVLNLGAQVSCEALLRRAGREQAEAILVSQVVTQKNVHIHNLTKLIELAEAEGVRDVSMTNALFFNISAFVGTAIGWAVAFYALYPEWQALGISAFAWMAILTGVGCYFLGMIIASLTTAMPRSGGDYVFTSRIISPFWGWIESWTLVGSAVTIIGFEIIVASHNVQLTAILLGVAFPGSAFASAPNWLQDNASKAIVGVIVLLVILGISILRTRTFHKVVTGLTIFAIVSVAISFFGAFFISPDAVDKALPALGTSSGAIMSAATKAGFSLGSPDFSFIGLIGLAGLVSVVLFQFIGFQFSSYIAGEVKGNVRRSILFAVIGALVFAVFMNSLYQDVLGNHFGFRLVNAWGYLYWFNGAAAPLNGQPPFTPLMATAVYPGAWPFWFIVSVGNTVLNVLLCPVYAIFLSRIVLAWSLDRQVPEWFSEVNERTNAPLRVIVLAVLAGAVFYALTFFGLNLAGTTFFGVLLAGLTWIMPGINAILMPYRRPDLFQLTSNTKRFLSLPRLAWFGIIWLIFIVPVYAAAFVYPVVNGIKSQGAEYLSLSTSNTSGIGWALVFIVAGIVIYFVMRFVNNSRGINTKMMFQELPPD